MNLCCFCWAQSLRYQLGLCSLRSLNLAMLSHLALSLLSLDFLLNYFHNDYLNIFCPSGQWTSQERGSWLIYHHVFPTAQQTGLELCPFMNLFIHGCPHEETICGVPTLHWLDSLWKELLGWDVPCRHHWLLKVSWSKGSAECDVSLHNLMPFTVVSAWTQGPRGIWFKGRFGKAGEKATIVFWAKKKKKKPSAPASQLQFAFFYCFSFFYLFLWAKFQTHTE